MGRKAKFNSEQAKEIRRMSTMFSDEEILAQYPMSKKTLYFIQKGRGAYQILDAVSEPKTYQPDQELPQGYKIENEDTPIPL